MSEGYQRIDVVPRRVYDYSWEVITYAEAVITDSGIASWPFSTQYALRESIGTESGSFTAIDHYTQVELSAFAYIVSSDFITVDGWTLKERKYNAKLILSPWPATVTVTPVTNISGSDPARYVSGAEEITNGTFDTDASGWTGAVWTSDNGGSARISNGGGS